jgi:hypothetical protein
MRKWPAQRIWRMVILVGSTHFGQALERLVDAPLPREVHDGMNWI